MQTEVDRIILPRIMGVRNMLRMTPNGMDRALHLSITDDFNREVLVELLPPDKWTVEANNKINELVFTFIEEIFNAAYPESNANDHTFEDPSGIQGG